MSFGSSGFSLGYSSSVTEHEYGFSVNGGPNVGLSITPDGLDFSFGINAGLNFGDAGRGFNVGASIGPSEAHQPFGSGFLQNLRLRPTLGVGYDSRGGFSGPANAGIGFATSEHKYLSGPYQPGVVWREGSGVGYEAVINPLSVITDAWQDAIATERQEEQQREASAWWPKLGEGIRSVRNAATKVASTIGNALDSFFAGKWNGPAPTPATPVSPPADLGNPFAGVIDTLGGVGTAVGDYFADSVSGSLDPLEARQRRMVADASPTQLSDLVPAVPMTAAEAQAAYGPSRTFYADEQGPLLPHDVRVDFNKPAPLTAAEIKYRRHQRKLENLGLPNDQTPIDRYSGNIPFDANGNILPRNAPNPYGVRSDSQRFAATLMPVVEAGIETVVPGAGEAADVAVIINPNSPKLAVGIATLSLGVAAATYGLTPNAGPVIRLADSLADTSRHGAGNIPLPILNPNFAPHPPRSMYAPVSVNGERLDIYGPRSPYNRTTHYGQTPTAKDRASGNTDHDPPLVQHFYEGNPAKGEEPGFLMQDEVRRAIAKDPSNLKAPSVDYHSQGGTLRAFSLRLRKFFFGW